MNRQSSRGARILMLLGVTAAIAAFAAACVPDMSGISEWKNSQIKTAQQVEQRDGELATASELVEWTIALEGVGGKTELSLLDALGFRPSYIDVRLGDEIVRFEGVRVSDMLVSLDVDDYSNILVAGDELKETLGSDLTGAQFIVWIRQGQSLTAPALVSREGVLVGNITAIIVD